MKILAIFIFFIAIGAKAQPNSNSHTTCPKNMKNSDWDSCFGIYEDSSHKESGFYVKGRLVNGQTIWSGMVRSGEFGKNGQLIRGVMSDGFKLFAGEFNSYGELDGRGYKELKNVGTEGIFRNGELIESKSIDFSFLSDLDSIFLGKNTNKFTDRINKFNNELVKKNTEKKNIENIKTELALDDDRRKLDIDKQSFEQENKGIEGENSKREQANNSKISPDKKHSQINDTRRRLALVIGNAQYKNSPLRNPINDARDISDALTASGFTVSRYENLPYSKMREAVRDFGERLNRGDVGLFYFSGHAVQYRGKNYLLPINEDLKHSDEIPSSSLDIDFVLAKMESAKNDLNIVILDACRNNPIGAESRSIERGLTNISAAKGTFIAFATSPGNVALDGDGKNSPYTKNLTQAIRKGGMTLEQVFKEVRRNVISETSSQQVPWENSSILGDFYFR